MEVWSSPLTTLAKKYGFSDNGLRKICMAMNVPLPKAGHWAKAAAGKAPIPSNLPITAQTTTYQFNPPPKSETPQPIVDADSAWLKARLLEERLPNRTIVVTQQPTKWHPAVAPLRSWLMSCVDKVSATRKRTTTLDYSSMDIHKNAPVLGNTHRSIAMRVSTGTYERALAILNALAYAADFRGFEVELVKDHERLRFSLQSVAIDLAIVERLEDSFYTVRNSWNNELRTEKKKVPTGQLRLNVGPSYQPHQFAETENLPLEGELHRVFEYAYRKVVLSREETRRREIEMQKTEIQRLAWEETERQRKVLEQQRSEEQQRRKDLLLQTDVWRTAEHIRNFVETADARIEVEYADRPNRPDTYVQWRAWALGVADEIDPIEKLIVAHRDTWK